MLCALSPETSNLADHLEPTEPGAEREHHGVGVHNAVALAPLHNDAGGAAIPDNDALHLGDDDLGAGRDEDNLGEEARVDLRGAARGPELPWRRRGGRRVDPGWEQRVRWRGGLGGCGGDADGEGVDGTKRNI
jgi:hypothetical protein